MWFKKSASCTKKATIFSLLLLFVTSLVLRFWKLDSFPPSLFGDEIDVGLQAYSILTTGKDYLGNQFPILFHSFSEYRLPMQLYMDVPFVWLFGLNGWGVRLSSLIMGLLSIVGFYVLIEHSFGRKVAMISAVFMAFNPWHFIFSRQANDAGILLPFVIWGTYLYIRGLKNIRYLYASGIVFSLGVYAYYVASLFIPLYIFILILVFWKDIWNMGVKNLIKVFLVVLILLSPYLGQFVKGKATQRYSFISATSKENLELEVIENRKWSKTRLSRIYYNKLTIFTDKIIDNYSQAISANFLFVQGDPNPRQSIDEFGMFYRFDLILILVGFTFVIVDYKRERQKTKNLLKVLLIWFIVAPLASALTKDGGTHASRLMILMPPLVFLSGYGFSTIFKIKKGNVGKLVFVGLILFMLYDSSKFFHRYFVITPKNDWRWWQYGYQDAISYVKENDSRYSKVFINNTYEPVLKRFLFWYGYDMQLFQEQFEDDKHIDGIETGFSGFKVGDKYYFGALEKPVEQLAKKGNLVVASAWTDITNPSIFDNPDLDLLHITFSPTGEAIFYIYTGNKE